MLSIKTIICLVNLQFLALGMGMSIEHKYQQKKSTFRASVLTHTRISSHDKTTTSGHARSVLLFSAKTQGDYQGDTLRFTDDDFGGDNNHIAATEMDKNGENDESQSENFFTHFEEVVERVTRGVRIDNSNSKECACTEKEFILCNCSKLNHQSVPTDLHPNIDGLDLFRNMITSLAEKPFSKYRNLLYLSIQRNQVTILTNDSFHGLGKLLVLDLRYNKLIMKSGTYPVGVFNSLSYLIALRLNRNNKKPYYVELFYPHRALAVLKSLRLLSMDGLKNKTFDEGFGSMTSLETLTLSGYRDGYCKVTSLPKKAFEYLGGLRMLNMSNCFLDRKVIDTNVLSPLKNIHTLDFTWNERIGIQHMTTMLLELRNSNMKKLFIDRIERRFSPGTKVTGQQVGKLPRNLTHLVAGGNVINDIDSEVLFRLPKSLQYLDVSGNKMVFGRYLQNFYLLENLDTLKVDGHRFMFSIPLRYPSPFQKLDEIKYPNSVIQSAENEGSPDLVVFLPPKLRVLTMNNAGLSYYLSKLNFSTNNLLERLHLSGNMFPSVDGPFIGLNSLKYLHLSKCSIQNVHDEFFEHFPSLEYLDLGENFIGQGTSLLHTPFKYLNNLKYLSLHYNGIRKLLNDSFRGISSMETLDLGKNPFYLFNANISHMGRLRTLNLNYTTIHKLLPETMKHLNSLQDVKVYMHGAPIKCVCPNLDFLHWMTQSKAIPTNTNYICVLSNLAGLNLTWERFLTEVNIVSRECISNYALFVPVLGVTLLVFILIVGSIAYRYRWRLRYFYYGLDLRMDKRNKVEEGDFKYDVFVSYASDDLDFVMSRIYPELNQRGVQLCLHTRDFHAGEHIITNIIRCVKESRRTLVILTNKFLESKWCRCEFQMAKEEALVTGRKILISLIVEEIPKYKIWLELRANIEKNTYLPYPGSHRGSTSEPDEETSPVSEREMKRFWDKVVKDIKY